MAAETEGGAPIVRLRLGDVLLELDTTPVRIVAPRWEPGIFFKHVEHVDLDVMDRDSQPVAHISTTGGPVLWQVIRVAVPAARLAF